MMGRAALTLALALSGVAAAQTPTESVWQASSGLTPEQICPAWTVVDTSSANPSLGGGVLTLSTAANGEDMAYTQILDAAPDPLVVEFRTRFVAGASSLTTRGPIVVVVTTAADTGTLLFIDLDDVALVGAGDAVVDNANNNTSSAHTYRMAITAAGAVSVTYDGTPTLTGSTFTNAALFGPIRRVVWGDASADAYGASEWDSFAQNGTSCSAGATTTSSTLGVTTSSMIGPTTSSTTVFGATTTSTTRVKVPTTSSTTFPLEQCDDAEPGSLTAVRCRLDRLRTRIETENGLGKYQEKLLATLGRGIDRANEATIACDVTDAKTGRRRMKQLQRHLINMAHRLRSLSARKQLDAAIRAGLIQVIESIKVDVSAIRKQPCGA